MKIKFKINYKTEFGQVLKITGSDKSLGNFDLSKSKEMFPFDSNSGWWDCVIDVDNNLKEIQYKYLLQDNRFENVQFLEYGDNRILNISDINKSNIEILDFWRSAVEPKNSFETSAFKNIIFKYVPKDNKFELKDDKKEKKYFIFFV